MEDSTSSVQITIPPNKGMVSDWASDQKAFKGVPCGKAMMCIFLVGHKQCQQHAAAVFLTRPKCYT